MTDLSDPNTIAYLKSMVDQNQGLQRTNRYSVAFFGTPVPQPNTSFTALSVVLPQVVVDGIADGQSGYGSGRIVPKGVSYNNGVSLIVPTFNSWAFQDFMYRWRKALYTQDTAGTFTTCYYETVIRPASMKITTYTTNGQVTREHLFTEVYPIENQSTTGLNMQSGANPVLSYIYTFNFRDCKETAHAVV